VPAFILVEPVITSGPTTGLIIMSGILSFAASGAQVTKIVQAFLFFASLRAARTKGVSPHAAMPTTISLALIFRFAIAAMPSSVLSSAPSAARTRARFPPAIIP